MNTTEYTTIAEFKAWIAGLNIALEGQLPKTSQWDELLKLLDTVKDSNHQLPITFPDDGQTLNPLLPPYHITCGTTDNTPFDLDEGGLGFKLDDGLGLKRSIT